MNALTTVLKGPTIAAAMQRPYDNFTALRLGLALAVVVSHAFSVTNGTLGNEPLASSTGFTLGEHAVNGFFAISGFLVTMSFERRGWRDYLLARTLRIAPGLIAATLVVAFLFGAALTRLPVATYVTSTEVWRFVAATLTTFKSNTSLPGVFEANPLRIPIGTVWTLKYEVLCYLGVLVFGLAGLLRNRVVPAAVAAALFLALAGLDLVNPLASKAVQTSLRLPFIFAAGGAFYLWRDRVRISGAALAILVCLTALAYGSFLYRALLFASEAYAVLWIALAPKLSHPWLDLDADLSYGTYLYGWPVQQTLRQLFPTWTPLLVLVPSILCTLTIAAASWFLIEKPALALKFRALGRRTLKTIEPAAP